MAEVSDDIYILRMYDRVKGTEIDVTEDYFLLSLEPGYKSRGAFIPGELLPLAIHHPNGVNVCCADTTVKNYNQPSPDLENLSYLDADRMLVADRRSSLSLGKGYYIQAFLLDGEYCVCTDDFSQITYDGFNEYAYLSSKPKRITRIKVIQKKIGENVIDHIKATVLPAQ